MRIRWLIALALANVIVAAPATAVTFTDWSTIAATKIALLAEPAVAGREVSAIEVDAREGVVTLRGQVASDEARAAAGAVASRVAGVTTVKNELRVDHGDEPPAIRPSDHALRSRVTHALRRNSRLARAPIQVSVTQGVARLTGAVSTGWDRVRASEVARSVVGVAAVENDTGPRAVALELRS